MATERIQVIIDSSNLDEYLDKLKEAKNTGDKVPRQVNTVSDRIKEIRKNAKAAGVNLDDLPTLNRELRLIGGLIPGFGGASQALFQARRSIRGEVFAREARALEEEGLAPEVVKELKQRVDAARIAVIIYVVKLIYDLYKQFTDNLERQWIAYDNLLQEGLDLNFREMQLLLSEQTGFATWVDQFNTAVKDGAIIDELLNAIKSRTDRRPQHVSPLAPRGLTWNEMLVSIGEWINNNQDVAGEPNIIEPLSGER